MKQTLQEKSINEEKSVTRILHNCWNSIDLQENINNFYISNRFHEEFKIKKIKKPSLNKI